MPMMMKLPLLTSALALSLSLAGAAQNAKQPDGQATAPIRVTTRLVQVSVVAHDKGGQPVADLTKDDFMLSDDGRAQQIAFFSVETNVAPKRAVAPLPPDTYSNDPARQPGAPASLTVILFDGLNTSFADLAFARDGVIKFLQQLQPQDRVAICALGNQLRVLHDFTSSSEALVLALNAYGKFDRLEQLKPSMLPDQQVPAPSTPVGGTSDSATLADALGHLDEIMAGLTARAVARISGEYQRRITSMTLAAITAIANRLASLPGRKNLLWVSGSFPFTNSTGALKSAFDPGSSGKGRFDQQDSEMLTAIGALNNANVAIYPVDARGLIGTASMVPGFGADEMTRSRTAKMAYAWDSSVVNNSIQAMRILAETTGGLAFYNSNDIKGALRQAVDDTRVSYVLGFYPIGEKWDGTFHRLKVQVKRPDVQVRYRQGFYALPDEVMDTGQRQKLVSGAARSPLDATAILLTVRLAQPASASQPLRFQILIDPRELRLQPEGDRWRGSLSMVVLQKKPDGTEIGSLGRTFRIQIADSDYRKVPPAPVVLPGEWKMDPAAEQVRIAVCDNASSALGSITVPLPKTSPQSP